MVLTWDDKSRVWVASHRYRGRLLVAEGRQVDEEECGVNSMGLAMANLFALITRRAEELNAKL